MLKPSALRMSGSATLTMVASRIEHQLGDEDDARAPGRRAARLRGGGRRAVEADRHACSPAGNVVGGNGRFLRNNTEASSALSTGYARG